MGVIQVLLVLTAVLAYTQASLVYGSPRSRVAVIRHPSRPSIVTDDAYIPSRLRQVIGKTQDYGIVKDKLARNYDSTNIRRHRVLDTTHGLRDTLGRAGGYGSLDKVVPRGGGSLVRGSSYDGPSSMSRSSSGGRYDAGRLVQDLVFNNRRRGGSGFDSGRRIGDRFGIDGQRHPISHRDCHCRVNEVCELDRVGTPICLPRSGGIRGVKNQRGACDRRDASSIFNECSARRGMSGTRAYIYLLGSCQPFTMDSRYCSAQGVINNIFRTLQACEKQCLY